MQFYLHGSSISVVFYFFMFFCVFGAALKIAVLPAWELNSGELDLQFCVFLWFSKKLKKQFFARVAFSRFFIIFGAFWEAFWLSFGVLLESPSSLWRAGALLLVVFGSSGPSVDRPWALSATFCGVFGSSGLFLELGNRSGLFFTSFFDHFGFIF